MSDGRWTMTIRNGLEWVRTAEANDDGENRKDERMYGTERLELRNGVTPLAVPAKRKSEKRRAKRDQTGGAERSRVKNE